MTTIRPRPSVLALFDPLLNTQDADASVCSTTDVEFDQENADKENTAPGTSQAGWGKGTPLSRKRRLVDVGDDSFDNDMPSPKRMPFAELLTADAPLPSPKLFISTSETPLRDTAPHVRSPLSRMSPEQLGMSLLVNVQPPEDEVQSPLSLMSREQLAMSLLVNMRSPIDEIQSPLSLMSREQLGMSLLVNVQPPDDEQGLANLYTPTADTSLPLFLAPPPPLEKRELPSDVSADISSTSIILGLAAGDTSFDLVSDKLTLLNLTTTNSSASPILPEIILEDVPPSVQESEEMDYELAIREVNRMKKEGRWYLETKPSEQLSDVMEQVESLQSPDTLSCEVEDKENAPPAVTSPSKSKNASPSKAKSQTLAVSRPPVQRIQKRVSSVVPTTQPRPQQTVRRLSTIPQGSLAPPPAKTTRRTSTVASTATTPVKPDAPTRRISTVSKPAVPATRRPSVTAPRPSSILPRPSTVLGRVAKNAARPSMSSMSTPAVPRPSVTRTSLAPPPPSNRARGSSLSKATAARAGLGSGASTTKT